MKKELLVNELSIMYDIDKEVAITCIELALSKIIGKEVVSTEDGYAYFNHKKSIFVNVRIMLRRMNLATQTHKHLAS